MAHPATPFADVPRTARGHLGLSFYEAAFRIVGHLGARAAESGRGLDDVLREFPFLASYLDEIEARLGQDGTWADRATRLRAAIAQWEESVEAPLPLLELRRGGVLSPDGLAALVLLALVEEEGGFATLFAALQPSLGHRRPTVALLRALLPATAAGEASDGWALCRALGDAGLVDVLNPDAPCSEWIFRIGPAVWAAICGAQVAEPVTGVLHHPSAALLAVEHLIVGEAMRDRLVEAARMLASEPSRPLVVRGTAGSDRLEVAGAVARLLGRGVLEATTAAARAERSLGVLATLLHAAPVFSFELAAGETAPLPAPAGYPGPRVAILGREGGLSGADGAITIQLEPDGVETRTRRWERALEGRAADLSAIVHAFALPARHVRRSARLAGVYASLDRRETVTVADVRRAARIVNAEQLDSLATRLESTGGWRSLVVHPATAVELRHLERRCRARERLASAVGTGFPGGLNRGVRALFEGPSGTGKTLAARVLADELGLDLYRVDLAAVVNKYVGETEKNLGQVLNRAEDLDVVLLLDEGDSLMSRRTEVRSANDRYANLETNYVLQRLETYTGIVIATTNVGASIDAAFRRRMDVVVHFHLPDAEERLALWQLHLPAEALPDPAVLAEAAERHALTGGQIRNAAIHALQLGMAHGGAVDHHDIQLAIRREHRKAGASVRALEGAPDPPRAEARLTGFLGTIS